MSVLSYLYCYQITIKKCSLLYVNCTSIKFGEDAEKQEHLYTDVSVKWCINFKTIWYNLGAYALHVHVTAFLNPHVRAAFLKEVIYHRVSN